MMLKLVGQQILNCALTLCFVLALGCSEQSNVRYFAVADISPPRSSDRSTRSSSNDDGLDSPCIAIKFFRVQIKGSALFEQTNLKTGFYPAASLHNLFGDVSQSPDADSTGDKANTFQLSFDPATRVASAVAPSNRFTVIYGTSAQAITDQINAFNNSTDAGDTLAKLFGAILVNKQKAPLDAAKQAAAASAALAKQFTSIASDILKKQLPTLPTITKQPQKPEGFTAGAGAELKLDVTASPADAAYKWQFSSDGVAVTDIGDPSAITSHLDLKGADAQPGFYWVIVTSGASHQTASNPVRVGLAAPTKPVLTLNPISQAAIAGSTVVFKADADRDPGTTFQWKFAPLPVGAAAPVFGSVTNAAAVAAGTTGESLTLKNVAASDAGLYRLEITKGARIINSAPATLLLQNAEKLSDDQVKAVNQQLVKAAQAASKALDGTSLDTSDDTKAFTAAQALYDKLSKQ